ncbi:MAG TPA: MarR family transcriptional regulator [Candidatus Limnocylindrales bacterium]|nr:MarR family transcriptional regulator [Candidatus Limnocylindrales bacterium]
MADQAGSSVTDGLEQIISAGVALTTRAIATAGPGLELTFPQWRVLVVLGQASDGVRLTDIAQRIGVTPPATGRQVRRLERRGLVTIRSDERDRRSSRAHLTAEGLTALDAIRTARRAEIVRIAGAFEGRKQLETNLAQLARAFEGIG